MEEEKRSSGPVESSLSAANTVKGAVKAGKAISNAAKGAAAGGPMGAVLAGAASNKHVMGAVLAAVGLLLLPVLFVLMLPGLVFNGLTAACGPNSTLPLLNDSVTISQNVNEIAFTLNSILRQGLDDVQARIEKDFGKTTAEYIEVNNPYQDNPFCNANLIAGQYCAARSDDFASISIADMTLTLEAAISHLYSFTRSFETRTHTEVVIKTDPLGNEYKETIVVREKWAVYTVCYNGEEYLGDQVFALTAEEKGLAEDYAKNMSLFLSDGMFQGLLPDEYVVGPSYEGIVFRDGARAVVYYNQLDERFAGEAYGTDDIGGYGCGPTAMAIVVSTLTSETIDPIHMADWSYRNGYWCSKSGSYHTLIPRAAEHWKLPWTGATSADAQEIVDALADGKLVVAIMAKGHFTSSGHFIVLRGVTADGKILVADPASYRRSEKEWELSIILNEASKNAADSGGPFWIIG